MVNISKRVLDDTLRARILGDLLRLIAAGDTERHAVWQELLSSDEQLQFAKRIALVLLLEKGERYDTIAHTLAVSPSTIAKHDKLRAEGAYRSLQKRATGKRIAQEIGILLLGLLDIATTPYVGERRRTLRARYSRDCSEQG